MPLPIIHPSSHLSSLVHYVKRREDTPKAMVFFPYSLPIPIHTYSFVSRHAVWKYMQKNFMTKEV